VSDFYNPNPASGPPRCSFTEGPWVLFVLDNGKPWLFTAHEEYDVEDAIDRGASLMAGSVVAAELLPKDWERLLIRSGPYLRYLHDGSVQMAVSPYGDVINVRQARA
jgi:hypothetical protein